MGTNPVYLVLQFEGLSKSVLLQMELTLQTISEVLQGFYRDDKLWATAKKETLDLIQRSYTCIGS